MFQEAFWNFKHLSFFFVEANILFNQIFLFMFLDLIWVY